ncbi:uncharacterized protein LOC107661779 [Sinocyclocheilus anshuiensis]|uniref:uncharacterized protein LOC107661779 n=1 Tax=Sinocyclocheilus anshuiensis TaxID=1608454 RepID=UPI0007B99068|nr:PREDICTED: uncharacterized protein LOC107661779 [Sinocyclocheilus anshuiensis]
MKTILLLVFAVLVSSAPAEHNDKNLLGEIIDELDKAVNIFSKENKGNEIFLKKLQMVGCKREVFCQAEQELIKKVSGLSGAKFDHLRIDKKLMRTLNMYNKRHVKTCKPADEDQDEILLHAFLKNLLTCVKSAYSHVNARFVQYFCEVTEKNFSMKRIPANLSEMTLPAELEDELDMAMSNVLKETKEKKILLKDAISDKILVEATDDELDTSMKNVSKEKEGGEILPKGAISNKTLPEELDDELNKAVKHVPKEAEEKKVLLKVAISDNTPKSHSDKKLLGEIIDELDKALRIFSKENKGNEIFLTKLQMDGCRREVFCQAEQELLKKVSGLSGAKFDHLRFGKKLMRTLNMYNERHVKTCKPADEDQDPILLHAFLKNLLTCVKSAYSHVK